MSAPHDVIDLDNPDSADPPGPPWRSLLSTRVPLLGVVALVVAGVLAGAVSAYLWAAAQERSRNAAQVSLFIAVAGIAASGGGPNGVTIEGTVAVVNSGPLPVVVSSPPTATDFVLDGVQELKPGDTGWFSSTAFVPCYLDMAWRPMPVELAVRTADGRQRRVTLRIQVLGSLWQDSLRIACQPRG